MQLPYKIKQTNNVDEFMKVTAYTLLSPASLVVRGLRVDNTSLLVNATS